MKKLPHFCGCCGGKLANAEVDLWCRACFKHILKGSAKPLWERTYFAQHGRNCPLRKP